MQTARLLLEQGADVDEADRDDISPLSIAAEFGHTAVCSVAVGPLLKGFPIILCSFARAPTLALGWDRTHTTSVRIL